MKKTGIPELEIGLITNLYWKQQAVVKTAEGLSNSVNIQQGGQTRVHFITYTI